MNNNTKILITGAAGFIGKHLVDYLLSRKISKSSLRFLVEKKDSKIFDHKLFDVVVGDIRDKNTIKDAMKGVGVVYHLAAKIDFDGASYKEYKNINVDGTQNLLDEAKKIKNFQKFIFFSSIGVYGMPADRGEIVNFNEDSPHQYSNYYGRSKSEAEKRVVLAFKKFKVPYVIIRPASVYGPGDTGPTYTLFKSIYRHRFVIIGDGKNLLHYVFVNDLVKASYLAQKSSIKNGDYIIAGRLPTSLSEVASSIADAVGVSIPRIKIPKNIALIGSVPFGIIKDVFKVNMPIYPFRVRTMTSTYYYDIAKSMREIKYKPKVDFKDGAYITGRWYLDRGLL